jgi:hypothetical protein
MSFNFDEYYNTLQNGEVLLSYKGSITTEWINSVLESVENNLESKNEDSKIRKKIYNVLVEGLQNLYHHVDELPSSMQNIFAPKFGMLIIKKIDGGYTVSLGNFINTSKIKYLKDKIDKINSLTQDELKDMYKFILNHQKLSAKGGGGLGLVDIARKTGNKLEYNFLNFDDEYYFFVLDVKIN